jgi:DNA-binding CsgD family transcriptional regulator/tetratricopeptide (TPR) repeat protein
MAAAEHLIGRAAELSSIDRCVEALEQGRPGAIELVGEPGIGKTRLLAELAARADARGHLVLSGSASELERDLPFWVFVDALDEYLQGLEPWRLDDLDDGVRAELATVFPSLSSLAAGRQVAPQHERYRSHRAVRALLELLATEQPLVLMLDDLHWCDPASIELLGALLHRPPAAPVLLALAARPRQTAERLAAALDRAHRSETLARLELVALTSGEAGELLGEAVAGDHAAVLYEESGGNPFYLQQLARTRKPGAGTMPIAPDLTLGGVEVPATVVAALAEELGLLPERARRLLEGAAVAGDPFDPDLAGEAAGVAAPNVIGALDDLLLLDLIRPTDVPRRFRFRHPLVRRAVYEATAGGWRLGAHERAAIALARRGSPASVRAIHIEIAAREGDRGAVDVLREAGEAAAARAPASAARWFEAALRLLPQTAPAREKVELLLAHSGALAATGRFADSHSSLLEGMRLVPEEADGALRVRLVSACASVEHLLGRHKQARARLESALDELDDPGSPEAVALMIELAADSLYRAEYDAMRGWAARATAAAAALGDRSLVAAALGVRALAGALSGVIPDARAHRDDAAALIDALGDDELARRLDALVHLATADMYLDRFDASGRHAERALGIGRATGQGDLFPLIYPMLGTALWMQGRVAESGEVLDGAVEAARLVDNLQGVAWNLFNRTFAAIAAGDVQIALATAEQSVEIAKDLDEGMLSGHAAWALAAARFESGRAEEAADLLVADVGGEELRRIPGGWRAVALDLLTRCRLDSGRRPEAERAAAAASVCAQEIGLPMTSAMAALATSAIALDAGDAASAAASALEAAAVLEDVGAAYYAATARALAGRALAQAGEPERAAVELEHAAAAFDSFGSARHRASAERELRKLGRRIHRRSRPGRADATGVGSLTARELEIARLVVDRRTNPEIAAELFLSPKTVETHLRNVFHKLDVSSRVDVARAVEAADG